VSDVVFVQMPFAGVERPSVALGLLTASLRAAHVSTEAIYANIRFAEQIGLGSYTLAESASPSRLIGEWLFAESAFGAAAHDLGAADMRPHFQVPDEFINIVVHDRRQTDLPAVLGDLRRQASAFVDALSDEIVRMRPKVVGCTSMFEQHVASIALLQHVKQRDPGILTVIGGPNCHGAMGPATHRAFPAIDFTVTGEFDQYVVEFFTALLAAEGDATRVVLPPNVLGPADRPGARRSVSLSRGIVLANADAPVASRSAILTDMDSAAVPDYDDYFEQIYSSPLANYVITSIPLETSRGCWWGAKQHCTFCGLNAEGMAFRKKSAGRALDEIRALTSRYGVYRWSATDNIIDMSYFQSVLPALAADERKYTIFYETKANLKREQVKAMSDAGCNFIQPGIESLHDETLKIMKKGATACGNIQLMKFCLEYGVSPAWNMLCGFPGSDPDWLVEIAAEMPALFHLPPPIGTTTIRYDRFSPYHQRPEAFGLELAPLRAYAWVYPLDEAVLNDLAYFFRSTAGYPPRVVETTLIARDVTTRWKSEFKSPKRPILVIESDDGDLMRIRDTRSCATANLHELRGPLSALLRAMELPTTLQGIVARLQEAGWTSVGEESLIDMLDDLRQRHLIWRASTQYLALATPPPSRPMPNTPEVAVGKVDVAKYLAEKERFKLTFAGQSVEPLGL
jgi:ribosomal peptide maturation radical SAM protein 1